MFCSKSFHSDSGTCHGDSGAGALYRESEREPYVLFGVLHGSIGENCNSQDKPSTFLRVDEPEILTWIENTMQGSYIFTI